MDNKSSLTALMSAFGRAWHSENEAHPVFCDTLAKSLMTQQEYDAVQGYLLGGAAFFEGEQAVAEQTQPALLRRLVNHHIAPSPLCRAAYAERTLRRMAGKGDVQYVVLGAGLDTFAFREPEFALKHRVFEVDHPLTQADKKARIARAGWAVPGGLRFVPVDFSCDSLRDSLLGCGYEPAVRGFFSWLGVSYYLPMQSIDHTLAEIASLCVEGSMLVFDYPDENFFAATQRRVQNTVMMARAGGEPMLSCFSRAAIEELLNRHGFEIRELLTPEDIQRSIIDPSGADIRAFEHVNYCLAAYADRRKM